MLFFLLSNGLLFVRVVHSYLMLIGSQVIRGAPDVYGYPVHKLFPLISDLCEHAFPDSAASNKMYSPFIKSSLIFTLPHNRTRNEYSPVNLRCRLKKKERGEIFRSYLRLLYAFSISCRTCLQASFNNDIRMIWILVTNPLERVFAGQRFFYIRICQFIRNRQFRQFPAE